MSDLMALRDKAKLLICNSAFCSVLYRNKSPDYFRDVFNCHAGVMKVYRKDNSGDQASPINGQIDGPSYTLNYCLAQPVIQPVVQRVVKCKHRVPIIEKKINQ